MMRRQHGTKRNKDATKTAVGCLQWAIREGIQQHLFSSDSQGEPQNGKLYCCVVCFVLCAIPWSTKGASSAMSQGGNGKNQMILQLNIRGQMPANQSLIMTRCTIWQLCVGAGRKYSKQGNEVIQTDGFCRCIVSPFGCDDWHTVSPDHLYVMHWDASVNLGHNNLPS